jgi:hypothetical protein
VIVQLAVIDAAILIQIEKSFFFSRRRHGHYLPDWQYVYIIARTSGYENIFLKERTLLRKTIQTHTPASFHCGSPFCLL